MTWAGAGGSLRRVGGFVMRFGGEARAALPPDWRPRSLGNGVADGAGGGGVGASEDPGGVVSGIAGGALSRTAGGTPSGSDAGRGGAATGRGPSELFGGVFSCGPGLSLGIFGLSSADGFSVGGGGLSLFGAVFASEDGSPSAAFAFVAPSAGAATLVEAAGGALFVFGVASAGGGADSMRGGGTDSRRGAGAESRRGAGAESRRGAGAESRRGAGVESRFGFGGGARRRDVVGGIEPAFGGNSLPGSVAGGGIGELRISGRPGAPGGRLGVPTETTGTLGILAGGGMLSELDLAFASAVAPSAVTSASSMFEDSGFDVMRV
jgi:hypothetical protein